MQFWLSCHEPVVPKTAYICNANELGHQYRLVTQLIAEVFSFTREQRINPRESTKTKWGRKANMAYWCINYLFYDWISSASMVNFSSEPKQNLGIVFVPGAAFAPIGIYLLIFWNYKPSNAHILWYLWLSSICYIALAFQLWPQWLEHKFLAFNVKYWNKWFMIFMLK